MRNLALRIATALFATSVVVFFVALVTNDRAVILVALAATLAMYPVVEALDAGDAARRR
jgi:hypothetical protein